MANVFLFHQVWKIPQTHQWPPIAYWSELLTYQRLSHQEFKTDLTSNRTRNTVHQRFSSVPECFPDSLTIVDWLAVKSRSLESAASLRNLSKSSKSFLLYWNCHGYLLKNEKKLSLQSGNVANSTSSAVDESAAAVVNTAPVHLLLNRTSGKEEEEEKEKIHALKNRTDADPRIDNVGQLMGTDCSYRFLGASELPSCSAWHPFGSRLWGKWLQHRRTHVGFFPGRVEERVTNPYLPGFWAGLSLRRVGNGARSPN